MTSLKQKIIEYCLSKPNVEETMPFDNKTWVAKVYNKMFLLFDIESDIDSFNVKCDPEYAIELRANYPELITPGYHMNKKHWNTIIVDNEEIRFSDLKTWIDDSYDLVLNTIPKSKRTNG